MCQIDLKLIISVISQLYSSLFSFLVQNNLSAGPRWEPYHQSLWKIHGQVEVQRCREKGINSVASYRDIRNSGDIIVSFFTTYMIHKRIERNIQTLYSYTINLKTICLSIIQ